MIRSRRKRRNRKYRRPIRPASSSNEGSVVVKKKKITYRDILMHVLRIQKEQFLRQFGWIRSTSDLRHEYEYQKALNDAKDYEASDESEIEEFQAPSPSLLRKRRLESDLGKSTSTDNNSLCCNMDAYLDRCGVPKFALVLGISLIILLPTIFFNTQILQLLNSCGSEGSSIMKSGLPMTGTGTTESNPDPDLLY